MENNGQITYQKVNNDDFLKKIFLEKVEMMKGSIPEGFDNEIFFGGGILHQQKFPLGIFVVFHSETSIPFFRRSVFYILSYNIKKIKILKMFCQHFQGKYKAFDV